MLGNSFIYFILVLLYPNAAVSTGGFPKGFLNEITESDVVKTRLQSRWKWEVWDVVPGTHIYSIYVYNVTNPVEVEGGSKPILSEVGPYAYVEHRTKFNVSVNLDLTVNYQRNFTYTFDSSRSKGKEDDLVTVLNVPFIIFSSWANKRGGAGNEAVNALVSQGEGLLKRRVRVGDFIFDGMDVEVYQPFLNLLNRPPSPTLAEFQSGRYGVLKLKRGANEGAFRVDSGLRTLSSLGQIESWNGDSSLDTWYGSPCDKINGTDGTVLPPYISNSEPVEILDVDLCRSISFLYDHQSTFESTVPTLIFKMNPSTLSDPREDSSSLCFCKNPGEKGENCFRKGVMDVSGCKDDAPYVMSLAHFYNADKTYIESVEGITPTPSRDVTEMSVQAHFQLDEDKAELLVAEIANELGGYGNGGAINKGFWLPTFLVYAFILSRAYSYYF